MGDLRQSTVCVVFVCNKAYFSKFVETCQQLLTNGNYRGSVSLIIGDDLENDPLLECSFIKEHKIQVKHFPDIEFKGDFLDIQYSMPREWFWREKLFQYHKFYLFDTFFKQWDFILYLDCGVTIFSDITPILQEATEGRLVAFSDGYPKYIWKLDCQFHRDSEYYPLLSNAYNLQIDYFQTTLMLYDTNLIKENTLRNIIKLAETYPISKTNDQGILSLYFTAVEPVFKQISIKNDTTYLYDYNPRDKISKYIILKKQ